MEFISKNTIKLDRTINELDKFVIDFIRILRKYVDYIIVSGYVAILFGRSRATEDVDILIEKPTKEAFIAFCQELFAKGYWGINSDSPETLWEYLISNTGIRFAKKPAVIPNMELKFIKTSLDHQSMQNKVNIILDSEELFVGTIELQIAYKRFVLASPKDLEDAQHLMKVLKDFINNETLKKYENQLKNYARTSES